MSKVYIGTTGCYSSYQIVHVFATEQDARDWRAEDPDERDYEEHEVLTGPLAIQRRPYHRLWWRTFLDDDLDGSTNPDERSYPEDYKRGTSTRPSVTWHRRGEDTALLQVEGWDHDSVLKAYQDERAAFLAHKAGLT